MFDYKCFDKMNITFAAMAVYCEPSDKPDGHSHRSYQGIVMNEPNGKRIYTFSDGKTMLTEGSDIFFLPKDSTYKVQPLHNMEKDSGCYCINFDADIRSEPFLVKPKNPEHFLKLFDTAAKLWRTRDKTAYNYAIRTVYDLLIGLEKESNKTYMPNSKEILLSPAIEKIKNDYANCDISISELSRLCGISDTYFRRLFFNKFGITPKEYIINLRMKYAKELLMTCDLSISSVASMCGYAEPCHFSREFSRIIGISPSLFVKEKTRKI